MLSLGNRQRPLKTARMFSILFSYVHIRMIQFTPGVRRRRADELGSDTHLRLRERCRDRSRIEEPELLCISSKVVERLTPLFEICAQVRESVASTDPTVPLRSVPAAIRQRAENESRISVGREIRARSLPPPL